MPRLNSSNSRRFATKKQVKVHSYLLTRFKSTDLTSKNVHYVKVGSNTCHYLYILLAYNFVKWFHAWFQFESVTRSNWPYIKWFLFLISECAINNDSTSVYGVIIFIFCAEKYLEEFGSWQIHKSPHLCVGCYFFSLCCIWQFIKKESEKRIHRQDRCDKNKNTLQTIGTIKQIVHIKHLINYYCCESNLERENVSCSFMHLLIH